MTEHLLATGPLKVNEATVAFACEAQSPAREMTPPHSVLQGWEFLGPRGLKIHAGQQGTGLGKGLHCNGGPCGKQTDATTRASVGQVDDAVHMHEGRLVAEGTNGNSMEGRYQHSHKTRAEAEPGGKESPAHSCPGRGSHHAPVRQRK